MYVLRHKQFHFFVSQLKQFIIRIEYLYLPKLHYPHRVSNMCNLIVLMHHQLFVVAPLLGHKLITTQSLALITVG